MLPDTFKLPPNVVLLETDNVPGVFKLLPTVIVNGDINKLNCVPQKKLMSLP